MDIMVIRAAHDLRAWDLSDVLGSPMGRISEVWGPRFIIELDEHAPGIMGGVPPGPFSSLEAALRAIEEQTHGACRHALEHDEGQP